MNSNNGQLLPFSAVTSDLLDGLAQSFKEMHKNCTPGHCVHHGDANFEATIRQFTQTCENSEEFMRFVLKMAQKALESAEQDRPLAALGGIAVWGVMQGWKLASSYLEAQTLDKMVQ